MYLNVIGSSTNQGSTGDTQDIIPGLFDTDNRELHPNQGRWISPDPAGTAAVDPMNPQSWNRYAYAENDPNLNVDPSGLCDLVSGGITQTPGSSQTQAEEAVANELGANLAFPFSDQNVLSSLFSGAFGSRDQEVLANAIIDTVHQSAGGPTNLYLFSGSAGLFAQVYPSLPADVQAGITSVTYFSPGRPTRATLPMVNYAQNAAGQTIATNIIVGNTPLDALVTSSVGIGNGILPGTVLECGHDANCEFAQFASLFGGVPTNSTACAGAQTFTNKGTHHRGGHGGHRTPPLKQGAYGGSVGAGGGDSSNGSSTTTINYGIPGDAP